MMTKNIFIDTQSFMQEAFKFNDVVLRKILHLSREGKINLVISEVVKREVESKINEKILVIIKNKKDLCRNLTILEELSPSELKAAINKTKDEDLLRLGKEKWEKYLKESKAIILDPNEFCVNDLLSHYFNGSYPFSSGKKKNEFPDAISLLSIREWTDKNNECIYVVSNDGDLKKYCENRSNFISLNSIREFLGLYNENKDKKELTKKIRELLNKNNDNWLNRKLKEGFMDCVFDYEDNPDAEVEDVIVNDINIFNKNLIDIKNEIIIVSFRLSINFNADITGPDYDNAMWDSEGKIYYFLEDFNINLEVEEEYNVTVGFTLDKNGKCFSGTKFIQYENENYISISSDDEL